MDVDFIAVSFVKTADVINNLKSYLTSRCDKVIEIVAKIESHDSVPNAQDIIEASDAVMIARGDLGTALPCPALPCPGLPCSVAYSALICDVQCLLHLQPYKLQPCIHPSHAVRCAVNAALVLTLHVH